LIVRYVVNNLSSVFDSIVHEGASAEIMVKMEKMSRPYVCV